MKDVIIYTDGACSGNPGPGGWAAVLLYKGVQKVICGSEEDTTNNRMELMAASKALSALKFPCKVILRSDSQYLKNGISAWINKWIKNNWKTSNGKPVKNIDLWQDLRSLSAMHEVTWEWVKGHSGDNFNDMADSIAVEQVRLLKEK